MLHKTVWEGEKQSLHLFQLLHNEAFKNNNKPVLSQPSFSFLSIFNVRSCALGLLI